MYYYSFRDSIPIAQVQRKYPMHENLKQPHFFFFFKRIINTDIPELCFLILILILSFILNEEFLFFIKFIKI